MYFEKDEYNRLIFNSEKFYKALKEKIPELKLAKSPAFFDGTRDIECSTRQMAQGIPIKPLKNSVEDAALTDEEREKQQKEFIIDPLVNEIYEYHTTSPESLEYFYQIEGLIVVNSHTFEPELKMKLRGAFV